MTLYDGLGAVGAFIVIVAYFLTQAGRLSASDWRFSLANIVGAALILASLTADWNLPAFVIELFWILISIYGLFRAFSAAPRR